MRERRGFTVIEWVLVAALVAIIAGLGWWAYQGNHKKAPITTKPTTVKVAKPLVVSDPYAEWKTYETKYERLKLMYPSDFTLKVVESTGSTVSPGMDTITITSPSGVIVDIHAGIAGIGGACPDYTVASSVPIGILGKQAYLNYVNNGSAINTVVLASGKEEACIGGLIGKNVMQVPASYGPASILATITQRDYSGTSLADFQKNPDVQQGVFIIKSFSY